VISNCDREFIVRTFEEEAVRASRGFPTVAAQYRACAKIIRKGGGTQDIVFPDSLDEERQRISEQGESRRAQKTIMDWARGALRIREDGD
jgi:hypothetical protein